jgi:hypothetical protein
VAKDAPSVVSHASEAQALGVQTTWGTVTRPLPVAIAEHVPGCGSGAETAMSVRGGNQSGPHIPSIAGKEKPCSEQLPLPMLVVTSPASQSGGVTVTHGPHEHVPVPAVGSTTLVATNPDGHAVAEAPYATTVQPVVVSSHAGGHASGGGGLVSRGGGPVWSSGRLLSTTCAASVCVLPASPGLAALSGFFPTSGRPTTSRNDASAEGPLGATL